MAKKNKHRKASGNKNNINLNEISFDDLQSLNLLNIQLNASIICIYCCVLSYIATSQGIEVLMQKYTHKNNITNITPDITALEACYTALFTRSIFISIAIIRYNIVYEKYLKGEFKYSLQPNIDFIIGNILGIISDLYFLNGVQEIYARDNNQPVFGV